MGLEGDASVCVTYVGCVRGARDIKGPAPAHKSKNAHVVILPRSERRCAFVTALGWKRYRMAFGRNHHGAHIS